MNKNSNKIRFYPRKQKQNQNAILPTPQETKSEQNNLFLKNTNLNLSYKPQEQIHQKQNEFEPNKTDNNENFVINTNNQENPMQQNNEANLKQLITTNDAQNITFINTLLKLKQKIIQHKKATLDNNNTSTHNDSLNNIEDNNINNNTKETISPKQLQLQIDDNSISSLQSHGFLNKKNNNPNSFNSNDVVSKRDGKLLYVQNSFFGNSYTNYGTNQNTTTVNNYNKYSGLKTKDLIEISNRRKMMTESNLDSHVRKKGFEEIITKKEGIKNDMEYKKYVFKPFASQINSKPQQIITSNNNNDIILPKTNKEIANEIDQQEINNNAHSNRTDMKLSDSLNNENLLANITNPNIIVPFENNDTNNVELIQDYNKDNNNQYDFNTNNNSNHIPVEERLFYSTEDLEQEALMMLQQRQNKPIKINLKEIKAEVQRKKEMNFPNNQTNENITSINSNYFPLKTTNNSIPSNLIHYNTNQENNEESLEDIIQSHLQNSNYNTSIQNDDNKYTNDNKTFPYDIDNTNDNEFKKENNYLSYKQNEFQEINKQINNKHKIINSNNNNNQILSNFNLSSLNNYIENKSHNNVTTNTTNNEPTNKYFTPKSSYYGDLLEQHQNKSNNIYDKNSQLNINQPNTENKEQIINKPNENEKFDLNKIHLLLTNKDEMNINNSPYLTIPTKGANIEDSNDPEKATSENMLTAQIELFNDNDEDEEEDIPEKISPSKIQQNSFPMLQQNNFIKPTYNINKQIFKKPKTSSTTTTKTYFNPIEPIQENSNEIDVDDLVEPSSLFQTSQTNSQKQSQSSIKHFSKSFCLSNPSTSDNNTQNDNKDVPNKIQFTTSNNSKTNIANEEYTSSTQKKHCKSKTNNFNSSSNNNNNDNKKQCVEQKKKIKKIPNTTRHSNIKKKNNENTSGNLKTAKNANPSFHNYFKNIFSQEQQTKSFNSSINKSNANNNNKIPNSSNQQNINKTIKTQDIVVSDSNDNNDKVSFVQDEELLSIINSSENMAEAIINQSFQRDINKQKKNCAASSSSYMVSNDVKEQLRVQFENQEISKGKVNTKIKNKGI